MLKYLRIAVTALGLTACVLLIALWVRSYSRAERLHWSYDGKRSIAVASKQGVLFLLHYENVRQPNAWKRGFYSFSTADQQSFPMDVQEENTIVGFGILRQPPYFIPEMRQQLPGNILRTWNSGVMFLKGSSVMILLWCAVTATGALSLLPWLRRFSLRTMLIATTLVAVGLGMVVYLAR
jgi:hypothetical protein